MCSDLELAWLSCEMCGAPQKIYVFTLVSNCKRRKATLEPELLDTRNVSRVVVTGKMGRPLEELISM